VRELNSRGARHRLPLSGSRWVRSVATGAAIHASSSSFPSMVGGALTRIALTTLPAFRARCGSLGPKASVSEDAVVRQIGLSRARSRSQEHGREGENGRQLV
jgi:hypothetical protein